jgi:predicted nucleic acid-binding protein
VIVLLDSGPLGWVTNPNLSPQSLACTRWLSELRIALVPVLVPEIADYEVRRELLRSNKHAGLLRLDALAATAGYLPISTAVMRRAAQLWADARGRGRPTADPHALDGDVILAAQAQLLAEEEGDEVIVATTNPRHLDQFVPARRWQEIAAP